MGVEYFGSTAFLDIAFHVMLERERRTSFAALVKKDALEFAELDRESCGSMCKALSGPRSSCTRKLSRGARPAGSANMSTGVGGKHAKLVSEWTGPLRVVSDDREHVCTVEHNVGDVRDDHVARMLFCADSELNVMRRIQDRLQHSVEASTKSPENPL